LAGGFGQINPGICCLPFWIRNLDRLGNILALFSWHYATHRSYSMNNPQETEKLVDELHNQPYEPMVAAEIWLVSISLFTGISILITLAFVLKN
jgi:uncharacterized membrane protein SpoIIM required for sporulation